ncbi:MAG: hypothetical protein GWN72_25860, partial [Nitrospinaceae bacterium]|nr:hypothetical protein [Nitrospinaceae bacterium]
MLSASSPGLPVLARALPLSGQIGVLFKRLETNIEEANMLFKKLLTGLFIGILGFLGVGPQTVSAATISGTTSISSWTYFDGLQITGGTSLTLSEGVVVENHWCGTSTLSKCYIIDVGVSPYSIYNAGSINGNLTVNPFQTYGIWSTGDLTVNNYSTGSIAG